MRTLIGSGSYVLGNKTIRAFVAAIFSLSLIFQAGTAFANAKYAGIVVDAKTGKTLYSYRPDKIRYPASLTKMMTLYMLFEQMDKGKVSKKTRIRMSKHSASMQPSKLGIRAGGSLTAEQAIYALITKSANDVAAAVGEHIGGTESQFGVLMTKKARSIGMSKTVFKNASGLPNRKQVTTARDMATLGIALREHYPQYFKYFSARSFKFGKRTYNSYNRLLGRVRGVDGIKTGYTRASGYNLVSSVYDRKRSIVAVVLGGKSGKSRNAQMTNLINRYLKNASTGRDRIVVAKGNPNKARSKSVFASIFKKPKKPSIPIARPTSPVIASSSMVTAYAAEPDNGPDLLQDNLIGQEIAALPTSQIPVPNVSPIARPDMVVTASTNVKGSTAAKASAQQPAKGWQIQIGAVPSKQDATNRLNAARKYQSKTLAKVENYTMMVETNGGTLYRARFAGFASKKQAWAACNKLKKKYDCLALAN